jgi:hypothetical protein
MNEGTTRFRRRWLCLLGVIGSYLLLWELTQLFGMPEVVRKVRASMPIISSYQYTDVPRNVKFATNGPVYYCRTTAYAPFVVRAEYDWHGGRLFGAGGSGLYFWFFGFTTQIKEIDRWQE